MWEIGIERERERDKGGKKRELIFNGVSVCTWIQVYSINVLACVCVCVCECVCVGALVRAHV